MVQKKDKLILGSLFAGVGGFELGAKLQGIETAFSVEIGEFNQQILKKHFPNTEIYGDIREFNGSKYKGGVNVVSGGFPCQDISTSNTKGAQGISGERSGLWSEMFRVIREVRPKYVVIENSSALTFRGLEQVLCDLSEIGYDAEWQCISGYPFGLAHKRERIYIIAYPMPVGRGKNNGEYSILRKVLQREASRQEFIPGVSQRYDGRSDFKSVRVVNDFSKRMDKDRVRAMGNAVIPVIASYIFKCIKLHYEQAY